jgi:hypothetical protein
MRQHLSERDDVKLSYSIKNCNLCSGLMFRFSRRFHDEAIIFRQILKQISPKDATIYKCLLYYVLPAKVLELKKHDYQRRSSIVLHTFCILQKYLEPSLATKLSPEIWWSLQRCCCFLMMNSEQARFLMMNSEQGRIPQLTSSSWAH